MTGAQWFGAGILAGLLGLALFFILFSRAEDFDTNRRDDGTGDGQ